MMTEQKLTERTGVTLVTMCFLAYMTAYFGRLNFTAAMTEMIASGLMDKQAAGIVNTAFYLVYGGGQLLFGALGDRFSPFLFVGGGLVGSALANLAMYIVTGGQVNLAALAVVWGLNGLAQSALWSPIIRILSTLLEPRAAVAACSNMLIACTAGTVGSYPLSTILMKTGGWRSVFLVPGFILITAAAGWMVVYASLRAKNPISAFDNLAVYRKAGGCGDDGCHNSRSDCESGRSAKLLPLLTASGVLFMVPAVLFMAMLREGSSTWTPVIITEMFGKSPSDSVLITAVIPLISTFGVVAARRLHERRRLNNMLASALYFALITLCNASLLTSGFKSLPVIIASICGTATFSLALNAVQVSIIPAYFARYGRSGIVCGVLNSIAAFASSASSLFIGAAQPVIGWNGCVAAWIAMAALSALLCLALARRWKRFAGDEA